MKILTPIILIAVSLGLFYWFISPQYTVMQALKLQQQDYDGAISTATKIDTKRSNLISKRDNFSQDDLTKLDTILPDSVDSVQLIIDMSAIAAKHGSTMSAIKVFSPEDLKKAQPQPQAQVANAQTALYGNGTISYSVTMTYDQFQSYLADLEHNLQLVDISSVSFKPADQGNQYTFNITARVYYLLGK
jgi:hypothetical protein